MKASHFRIFEFAFSTKMLVLLILVIGRVPIAVVAAEVTTSFAASGRTDDRQTFTESQRPNLIFIMTDDQGPWSVGAYGNEEAVTPNIDQIASEGALFSNAFSASPVCTPSRVSFLTGLYPSQVGLLDIEDRIPEGAFSGGLPQGVPTWPRVLREHGWSTGLIGKWHLGHDFREHHPKFYGIDYFYGLLRGGDRPMDARLYRNGDDAAILTAGSLPDILTDDAIRFIEMHHSKPFALMLHLRAPHLPYGPVPAVDRDVYVDQQLTVWPSQEMDRDYIEGGAVPFRVGRAVTDRYVEERLRAYMSSVHSVDRNIGRLMKALETLQLDQRTILVFTSDQGYFVGQRGLREKGVAVPIRTLAPDIEATGWSNMLETAIQIPLVVRWPGMVRPGIEISELVSNVDVATSILGMLDVAPPSEWPSPGRDFSPLLRGESVSWDDVVYGEYSKVAFANGEFVRMIRTDKWKLVRGYFAHGGRGELYDLESDPDETENLYYPNLDDDLFRTSLDPAEAYLARPTRINEARRDLEARLIKWQRSIDDPILDLHLLFQGKIKETRESWAVDK